MNVSDKWMLEQMQQMAASMATSLPQTGQNTEQPSKTEKGESFKDLMDKAKDKPVEAPEKDNAAPVKKEEAVQGEKPVQTVEKTQKTVQTDPKTGARQVMVTAGEAALLAAGYAKLSPPMEDGTVWMVTVQDENGNPVLPLAELEGTANLFDTSQYLTQGEWVLTETTPEFTQALAQLLQRTNDPRTVDDILTKLAQKLDGFQEAEGPEMEVVLKTAGTEQNTGTEQNAGTLKQADSQEREEEPSDLVDAQAAAPKEALFKDVKGTPVKVGENFQLDTQEPDMDANLADAIRFASQQGLRQLEIKLSPENLGNLTIKLTQASDGTLQVVLHTANAKAATLLDQHMDGLNAALQGYGRSEVQVEVQRGEESQQGQQQQQHQADPNGHNQQQQQQRQQQQDNGHSGDFIQKLRLGLFNLEDIF